MYFTCNYSSFIRLWPYTHYTKIYKLEYLNYSKITDKEKLNAETYYLGQIAIELSSAPAGGEAAVLAQHPRYKELCEEYGEPSIWRNADKDEHDSNSLAARLVNVTFNLADDLFPDRQPRSWKKEIPKSSFQEACESDSASLRRTQLSYL